MTIPNTRPVAGQSFQIEAFGTIGPTATATAFVVDILAGPTVLASAEVRPLVNAGVRSWAFTGWVHVGTYNASTQVAGLRTSARLTLSGIAPVIGNAVNESAAITALSACIRTLNPAASQVTACQFATIIEIRPQFSDTIG